MERIDLKLIKVKALFLAAALIFVFLNSSSTYGQSVATSLLVQKTPPNGGDVTPEVGVHQINLNTDIKLTAVPKPGYQFVYWLGDVLDPTSSSTTVYTEGPKIVIAVFERVAHEFVFTKEAATSAPAQGLIPNRYTPKTGGGGGGGKKPPKYPRYKSDPFPVPQPSDEPEDDDFPVPEPIPEPASVLLMSFGSWFIMRKRKSKTLKTK